MRAGGGAQPAAQPAQPAAVGWAESGFVLGRAARRRDSPDSAHPVLIHHDSDPTRSRGPRAMQRRGIAPVEPTPVQPGPVKPGPIQPRGIAQTQTDSANPDSAQRAGARSGPLSGRETAPSRARRREPRSADAPRVTRKLRAAVLGRHHRSRPASIARRVRRPRCACRTLWPERAAGCRRRKAWRVPLPWCRGGARPAAGAGRRRGRECAAAGGGSQRGQAGDGPGAATGYARTQQAAEALAACLHRKQKLTTPGFVNPGR